MRRARTLTAAIIGAGLLGLPACMADDTQARAIATARTEYLTQFPVEYTIAKWDIVALEEADGWQVIFSAPISGETRAIVGDVPATGGRMFILSRDGERVFDSISGQ